MKLWMKIVIAILLVGIIVGICVLVFKNKGEQPVFKGEADTFEATVILVSDSKIIVVPGQDEVIRQSFAVVDVIINDKTVFESEEKIEKGDTIKVSFNGSLFDTSPAIIIGDKIGLVKKAEK